MKKRYQVFISSTYTDLIEERRVVMETVMQLDCIPAGMELFPASDDEQFEFIKKVIDDCDYYILIIGGRYGSESYEGISYTEKEFDYALEQDIPVLVFIHGSPQEIPFGKSEEDSKKREKLEQFKEKASNNRLVDYWESKDELAGEVALSLSKAIKMYPQLGWIRGTEENSYDLLEQINHLRKENQKLNEKNKLLKDEITGYLEKFREDLAFGNDTFVVKASYYFSGQKKYIEEEMTWDKIFSLIGPSLFQALAYKTAKTKFEYALKESIGKINSSSFSVKDILFQKIKIQLYALGLINVFNNKSTSGGIIEFMQISEKGKRYLISILGIKKE